MSHQSYTGGPVENGYGNGAGTSMSASLSPNGVQRGLSQQSHDMVRHISLLYMIVLFWLELIIRHHHLE